MGTLNARAARQAKPEEAAAPRRNAAVPSEAALRNPKWQDFALGGVRSSALPGASPLQAKAQAASDPAEAEADWIAEQVVGGAPHGVVRSAIVRTSAGPHLALTLQRAAGEAASAIASPAAPSSAAPTAAAVTRTLNSPGRPLADPVRDLMEQRFGADFSGVRVHTDSEAAQSAVGIQARAYAAGADVVFNRGEYDPDTARGKKLLAHELAHVVQQGAAPPAGAKPAPAFRPASTPLGKRRVQRSPDLERMIDDEHAAWFQKSRDARAAGDYEEAAYARRVALRLNGVRADDFANADDLQAFLDQNLIDAESEEDTLDATGDWALMFFSEAFPITWSDRVHDALVLEVDDAALAEEKVKRKTSMEDVAKRVPGKIGEVGLPVPYADAATLTEFRLQLKHVGLKQEHIVKELALAARDYAAVGWVVGFCIGWNGMAESYADDVASGKIVVNYTDYAEFVETKQKSLRALGERIGTVTTEDLLKAVDDDTTAITHMAFVQAFAATLLGLIPAMMFWSEGTELFDEKLKELDKAIAAETGADRIYRAMTWASKNDYFGDAAWQLLQTLWDEKWKILLIGGALIGVQFVPGLNVAVDYALTAYAGVDALAAFDSLGKVFKVVASSSTAVALQRNAAKMAASMEGDGLRLMMDVFAITAAAKGIRTRADVLKKAGLREEEALKQAMKEATGKEAEALKGAAARVRIKASLDKEGLVDPLMDMGMNAEVLEQALMSGLKPRRIVAIAETTPVVARAEALIEYAGSHASPVNALIDLGVPYSRVADMMDAGLGLRELGVVQQVLRTTGSVARAEGLISTLAGLGEGAATSLLRLTPKGMADTFLAGSSDALHAVYDTIVMEGAGSIAGFDDWVRFSIGAMKKTGVDLVNAISELREAQRVARTLPAGQRVRVGGDAGASGKSFDMAIEDAAGRPIRSIDMTSVKDSIKGVSDLTTGIKHGIVKAPTLAAGTAEVTIRVKLSPSQSLGRGRTKVFDNEGNWQNIESDGRMSASGNLLQETAAHLPTIADSNRLSAVHLVRTDGTLIGSVVRTGSTWEVAR